MEFERKVKSWLCEEVPLKPQRKFSKFFLRFSDEKLQGVQSLIQKRILSIIYSVETFRGATKQAQLFYQCIQDELLEESLAFVLFIRHQVGTSNLSALQHGSIDKKRAKTIIDRLLSDYSEYDRRVFATQSMEQQPALQTYHWIYNCAQLYWNLKCSKNKDNYFTELSSGYNVIVDNAPLR